MQGSPLNQTKNKKQLTLWLCALHFSKNHNISTYFYSPVVTVRYEWSKKRSE